MKERKKKKKKTKKNKTNREILVITYFFLLIFGCFTGYFIYFMNVESETYITSAYNTRQDLLGNTVIRGKILSSDKTVLAETLTDALGNETRSYPYSNLFAHVLGYSSKGKSGLESAYNFYLLKSHVNPWEQLANGLSGKKNPGDNVITTLDPELQRIAYDGMGDYNGAVVVMEPATGKILAMVSKPDFDPNQIDAIWDTLVSAEESSNLLNRATAGMYPPGSTFKIVTALAYLRDQGFSVLDSFSYNCEGDYRYNDLTIRCFDRNPHGLMNLRSAFAQSCNSSFASIGMSIDPAVFRETAEELLFNREMPFLLSNKSGSFVMDASSEPWEVMQTSIGQGKTLITPLQNAMIVSAIANGGVAMKPYLVDRVETAAGQTVKGFQPEIGGTFMTKEEATTLTELMTGVVRQGTASILQSDQYQAAGKTGSAEYQTGLEDTHAWFVGFAPTEKPTIAVSIVLEDAGNGGGIPTSLAKQLFDAYLSR
ncbi:MAG: penicillin-binding protein 2 [Lachnospiraceae bacterium]|nr:penicillin-binding protein 2 [Lachnospiraceae bacterium]